MVSSGVCTLSPPTQLSFFFFFFLSRKILFPLKKNCFYPNFFLCSIKKLFSLSKYFFERNNFFFLEGKRNFSSPLELSLMRSTKCSIQKNFWKNGSRYLIQNLILSSLSGLGFGRKKIFFIKISLFIVSKNSKKKNFLSKERFKKEKSILNEEKLYYPITTVCPFVNSNVVFFMNLRSKKNFSFFSRENLSVLSRSFFNN